MITRGKKLLSVSLIFILFLSVFLCNITANAETSNNSSYTETKTEIIDDSKNELINDNTNEDSKPTSKTKTKNQTSQSKTINKSKIVLMSEPVDCITIKGDASEKTYSTLTSALADAPANSTLVVHGDVSNGGDFVVTKNVTIVAGSGGGEIATLAIINSSGSKLTLGSGNAADGFLTINGAVSVTNGEILVKDGVGIYNTGARAILLKPSGTGTVTGSITGGIIKASSTVAGGALTMEDGAKLTEISGGTFHGKTSALLIIGSNTRIDSISGGTFTNDVNDASRAATYLDNGAQVGTISGGTFTASQGPAMFLIRGGNVGTISGDPVFKSNSNTINYGIYAYSDNQNNTTGIGTISGGTFEGALGVVIKGNSANNRATIGTISGGTFIGYPTATPVSAGLEVDYHSTIDEIKGGTFTGIVGVINYSKINKISDGSFTGNTGFNNGSPTSSGYGEIQTISGGTFEGTNGNGFINGRYAKVGLISNGDFTASDSKVAVNNNGTIDKITNGTFSAPGLFGAAIKSTGTLNTITGGVYYTPETFFNTIELAGQLSLEPDLTNENQGQARFINSTQANIFNDDSLVTYVDGYFMSKLSESINGYDESEKFHYVTRNFNITYQPNGGTGTMDKTTDEFKKDVVVTESAFTFEDHRFIGWNTKANGKGKSYSVGSEYNLTGDLELFAQWESTTDPTDIDIHEKEDSDKKGSGNSAITKSSFPSKDKSSASQAGTGDKSKLVYWISLVLIAIAVGTVTTIFKRREQTKLGI